MDDRMHEILSALDVAEGTYPREAIDAALAMREEITPYLIAILRQVWEDPVYYALGEGSGAYIFALQLLAFWQEPQAHDLIVDLVSLPGETPFDLFGDTITEDLPSILLATCNRQVPRIEALLCNPEANEYCRSAAAHALVYAVVEGVVPRQYVIALFRSLLTSDESALDASFLELLASSVCDLYPEELMEAVTAAFRDELIVGEVVGYRHFRETLERGRAAAYERARSELRRHMPADFHDRMSWWASFRQEEEPTISPVTGERTLIPEIRSVSSEKRPRQAKKRPSKKRTRPPRKKRPRKKR